jgi:hypothetical protein
MSEESPEDQLSFDDERKRRVGELLASTDRVLGMVEASRANQEEPDSKPLDIRPSVQIHVDARDAAEQKWDEKYELEAKKWPGGGAEVREKVEASGTKRPIDGEDIEETEHAKYAEARAEAATKRPAAQTHAQNLHQQPSRTKRLKSPPKPGKGGEIDSERIIR